MYKPVTYHWSCAKVACQAFSFLVGTYTDIGLPASVLSLERICQSQRRITYFLQKDARQIGEVFSCRAQVMCRCCGRCQPCVFSSVVSDGNKDLCSGNWMLPFISIYYPMSLNTRSYVDTCGETPEFRCLNLSWFLPIMSDDPILYLCFLQEESV